jgi:hypothetical protein
MEDRTATQILAELKKLVTTVDAMPRAPDAGAEGRRTGDRGQSDAV